MLYKKIKCYTSYVVLLFCGVKIVDKNFGLDIDGVLNDMVGFEKLKGEKYFEYSKPVVNNQAFYFRDLFECDKLEETKFWLKNILDFFLNVPCREGAATAIEELKENGYNIHIITARMFADKKSVLGILARNLVKSWLKKNNIKYDSIHFCEPGSEDKKKFIKELCISIMLEDFPEEIKKMENMVKVICFTNEYNKNLQSVDRISGFEELNKTVLKLERKNEK